MSPYKFISGYESHADWYTGVRQMKSMGAFSGSEPPEWLIVEGKAIAERERLSAEIAATETPVEQREETEEEFYTRMVKRDAAVRAQMRANGMEPPAKETHDQWYECMRQWIKAQPGMSVWEYPSWIEEEGRLVAVREKIEDELRASGEMSPKRRARDDR